ncbi:MAG: SDR family NAD(P)-dependent oxidoreductase [Nostocoides sp.]
MIADRTAVVTGASGGIGEAISRRLTAAGYRVVLAARREDRLRALADQIGAEAVVCDVTDDSDVARLAAAAGPHVHVLVNNAGGALGVETVADADLTKWQAMYDSNVLGLLRVTKSLLPALRAADDEGIIVNVGSIAGHLVYEGGAGYVAAKHAVQVITETMRLELWDQPIRITEIAPGMVHTEGFALTRFAGDQAKADAVYAGVPGPLVADDVADAIMFMVSRPVHVNIDLLVIKPRAQAAPHKVHRLPTGL